MKALAIQETTLTIHVVKVGGSKMTKAVFDQIERIPCLPLTAQVLGYVHVYPAGPEQGRNYILSIDGKPYRVNRQWFTDRPSVADKSQYPETGKGSFDNVLEQYRAEREMLRDIPQIFIAV